MEPKKRCSKCDLDKVRIPDGKYKSGIKRYIDLKGKVWKSGKWCPDCRSNYNADYNKSKGL